MLFNSGLFSIFGCLFIWIGLTVFAFNKFRYLLVFGWSLLACLLLYCVILLYYSEIACLIDLIMLFYVVCCVGVGVYSFVCLWVWLHVVFIVWFVF